MKDIVAGVEEKQSAASKGGDGEDGETPASGGKPKRQKTASTANDSSATTGTNEKEYKFVVYGASEPTANEREEKHLEPHSQDTDASHLHDTPASESKAAISSVLNNETDLADL